MRAGLLAIVVGIPIAWHLGLTAVAYYDAGRVGLDPPAKWAAIVFLLPLFGFFIYLFERSELSYDPETDPYRRNTYNVHPTRADEAKGLHPDSGAEAGSGAESDPDSDSGPESRAQAEETLESRAESRGRRPSDGETDVAGNETGEDGGDVDGAADG